MDVTVAESMDLPKKAVDVLIQLKDLMPLLLPGALTAYNNVASLLGKKHKFNLLSLYILSLASSSQLPAKFTLKDLHRVVERF